MANKMYLNRGYIFSSNGTSYIAITIIIFTKRGKYVHMPMDVIKNISTYIQNNISEKHNPLVQ